MVGREAVCEALNLKQVQMLLIHPSSAYPGAFCPVDGSVAVLSTTCPRCLGQLQVSLDLSQHLRTLASQQDAEVVDIADAALFPADAEGLAALKRY